MPATVFRQWVREHQGTGSHTSSPACWVGGSDTDGHGAFVGGHDAFVKLLSAPRDQWPISSRKRSKTEPRHVTIAGYTGCGWFDKAVAAAKSRGDLDVHLIEFAPAEYRTWVRAHERNGTHTSSPAVWLNGSDVDPVSSFIGGHDAFIALLGQSPESWPEANSDIYDYDLVVIGGGSGGLACAKKAAETPGVRVAVLDFVKPSPKGSTWGLGGTCVNVGCIPKKLMHTAALYGELHHDMASYGWQTGEDAPKHSWSTLVTNVQEHISRLNRGYVSQLQSKNVKYYNALGSFVDRHTVKVDYQDGTDGDRITAKNIVIAVGGRPFALGCKGEEHAIDSDDLFRLKKAPGKTLVVGASYVALECAGFLTGIGFDTSVMVRSILLRGFDQDCANRIAQYMEATHTRMIRSATVSKIEPTADGRLEVTWSKKDQRAPWQQPEGTGGVEVFDTVMAAIGRYVDTRGLNLEAVGVATNKKGEIKSGPNGMESTNISNIYAIGDCLEGCPELTPVAIQSGKYLAARLFSGSTIQMPYESIATAVFTPIEYGAIGVSEDDIRDDNGAGEREWNEDPDATYRYSTLRSEYTVYAKTFKPLEWYIAAPRTQKCYLKIITDAADKVVGIHYLGPNAGEIMQGFSVAVKLGATFADLRATVGIHPTIAEHFTILESKGKQYVPKPKGVFLALPKADDDASACDT